MADEKTENIIVEYEVKRGDKPSAGIFKAVRSFMLKTDNKPLEEIPVGALVELSKENAEMLFYSCKVEPSEMPEKFKVLRSFKPVINDRYTDLHPEDVISFEEPSEALDWWRKGFITPILEKGE